MNIVFLVDYYYPKFSAVSKCAYNVAVEMGKRHKVTIISLDGEEKNWKEERVDNHVVVRGYVENFSKRNRYISNLNTGSHLNRVINRVKLTSVRAKGYLNALISKCNISEEIVNCYLNHLSRIDFDVIIPVCLPFESVVAAYRYKADNPKTVLLPFLFDKFTYNEALHRNNLNRMIKKNAHRYLEEQMVIYSDKIFAMHQLYSNFKKMFPEYMEKFSFVEHPTLCRMQLPQRTHQEDTIRLIYAGALYKQLRSPEYLLKISELMKEKCVLDFYTSGNCEDIINSYSGKQGCKINTHGYVAVQELKQAYANADILVGIGNDKSTSMASKVFEYMAIGKPIVHFYYHEDDPVLEVLKKYPTALLIKQDERYIKQNAQIIENFCKANKGKQINFETISEIYNDATPENIASYFEKYMVS